MKIFLCGLFIFVHTASLPAAVLLMMEGFESPALSAGGTTTSLPTGWLSYSGPSVVQYVYHPSGSSLFTTTIPLQAPAGGNQMLVLGRTNSGLYRMSGSSILGGTEYMLSAAIGNSLLEDKDEFWSLQLWADMNDNNALDPGDVFLNQQYGTSGSATLAAPGGWAENRTRFDSGANPSVVGKQLIVFLNNHGDAFSESFYDNISLTITPEPGRLMLVLSGLWLGMMRRQRRGLFGR